MNHYGRCFSSDTVKLGWALLYVAPSPLPHRIERVLEAAGGGAFAGFVEEGDRQAHQAEGDFGVSGHGPTLPCRKPATCPGARRRFEEPGVGNLGVS